MTMVQFLIKKKVPPVQIGGFKRQGDNMADANQKRRPAFGDITNVCDTISEIIYHQYPNI
jgi:hypothetical protein